MRGLDLAAAPDRVRQRLRIEPLQVVDVGFEPRKESRIDDDAVLDDLGEPGAELARWQRAQRARVGQNPDRLMERADHVLCARMVDGRLATDRRVDLRKQRRGHLHEIDASLVARRRVAREVADDAAAQRDEATVTVKARVDEAVDDGGECRQGLVPLAVRDDDRLELAPAPQGRLHARKV